MIYIKMIAECDKCGTMIERSWPASAGSVASAIKKVRDQLARWSWKLGHNSETCPSCAKGPARWERKAGEGAPTWDKPHA